MPNTLGAMGIGLGGQAASGLVDAGLGLLLQGGQDRRQIKQQQKLTDMQIAAQKNMGEYNYEQQMKMWQETNYKAQMEQLEKAGLNPALIYGMSGGGGATTGNSGSASGTGAEATKGAPITSQGMGIMSNAQIALLNAQKENIEADTANKKAGVPVQEATVPKIKAETTGRELENQFSKETMKDRIDQVNSMAIQAIQQIDILEQDVALSRATRIDKAKIVAAEAIGKVLDNALTATQTEGAKQQIKESKQRVQQMIEQVQQGWTEIDIKSWEAQIKQFTAEFQANHPGISQLVGGAVQRIADALAKPIKGREINKQ